MAHSIETKEKISKGHLGKHSSLKTEFKKGIKAWNKGKHHSEETKRKISVGRKGKRLGIKPYVITDEIRAKMRASALRRIRYYGEKAPGWKGGKTKESRRIRQTKIYYLWRKAVLEKDGFACVWCGETNGQLDCDHIKQFSLYPELRFAIDNGRVLCIKCHRTTYLPVKPNI